MIDEKTLLLEIRKDVKSIQEDINCIKVLDARQNANLEEHMRRTEASERRIDKLENFKWFFAGLTAIVVAAGQILNKLFN